MDTLSAVHRSLEEFSGQGPQFFEDVHIDTLLSIILGLCGEVAVEHQRNYVLTEALKAKGFLQNSDLEAIAHDEQSLAALSEWNSAFLARILRKLKVDYESVEQG